MSRSSATFCCVSPGWGSRWARSPAEGTVGRDAFVDAFPLLAEGAPGASLEPSQEEETSPARTRREPPAIPEPSRPSMPRPASPRGRSARPADRLAALPPSFFGGEQDRFTDLGPSGGVLVGVRVSYKLFFGGPKISSVAPIYRTGSKLVDGKRYGTLNGPEVRAVAKAGYAVGAFRTRAGLGVDGFEMVFMKVKGSRLDPNDSYVSPWLGDTNGGSPQAVLNPGGLLPVGLQGRASGSVRALGLIVVP
ncbi:MAG: hypothetical protein U0835_11315 [Isosphaeraceae bacterium]